MADIIFEIDEKKLHSEKFVCQKKTNIVPRLQSQKTFDLKDVVAIWMIKTHNLILNVHRYLFTSLARTRIEIILASVQHRLTALSILPLLFVSQKKL